VVLPEVGGERVIYARVAGEVIRKLRAGAAQSAVASSSELSQSALSRFENGKSLPDMYETRRLAHALGRTPGSLLDMVDEELVILVGRSAPVSRLAAAIGKKRTAKRR
jgi:transcriptional regulator with XRE-family HTH domain